MIQENKAANEVSKVNHDHLSIISEFEEKMLSTGKRLHIDKVLIRKRELVDERKRNMQREDAEDPGGD